MTGMGGEVGSNETVSNLGAEQTEGAVRFGQFHHYRRRLPTFWFAATKPVRDHPQV